VASTFEAATGDELSQTTDDPGPTRALRLPSALAAAPVARRIGKYDVIGLLGKGAMGAVYHAVDPLLERDVALKVMLAHSAEDPEQKHRFEREARAVARLMHPNVVTLFDLGYHTDGSPYIVMELLRGHDLLEARREGPPLSFTRIVEIVLEVLQGLRHAHDAGIIHRDIKPANVFLCDDGPVKIMDFGVAQFASLDVTGTGMVVGTANYMSPEQVLGERVDWRSDLWSVGCMLYELLAGRSPFAGEGVVRTLYNIAHREPVLDLPTSAEAMRVLPILKRALAKAPDQRYPTTAEFAADLRAALAAPAAAAIATIPAPPPPPAPARVDLDPAPLLELVRDAFAGRKSGHLHFTHGRERRSLTVYEGRLLHATSDVPGEHLGDVLVRYGLLDQSDLHRALAVVLRERRRLGAVLTDLRVIQRARLVEAVGLHVREILFTMMERTDGAHAVSFEETSEALIDPDLGSEQSTGDVVLEAVRRIHDDDLVRRALGDLGRTVAISADKHRRAEIVTLTPTDGFVLSRIDGVFTAEQVVSLVPLPRVDVERSLFGLLCAGIIAYAADAPRPRSTPPATPPAGSERAVAAPPAPDPAAAAPAVEPPPELPSPRDVPRAEELRKQVLGLHERAATADAFELLGVSRSATDSEIRDAWARLARVLHPDSWRNASLSDLHHIRDEVFVRLTDAYKTLRDPAKRSRYERERRPRVVEVPRPAAAPSPTASLPRLERVDPVPPVPADRPPGELVHQAEVLLKREKYWEAIQILEPVIARVEGPTRARARVALAMAYMKNPHWIRRAEDLLQDVVRDRPQHAAAYLVLGRLYRGSGFPKRAACMFRKALELEPEGEEAAAALAGLEPETEVRRRPRSLRALLG
jgi:serine/threonine-protein kinase